jgi:hypothetical protein
MTTYAMINADRTKRSSNKNSQREKIEKLHSRFIIFSNEIHFIKYINIIIKPNQ